MDRIDREIALVAERIEHARLRYRARFGEILREECVICSHLTELASYEPRHYLIRGRTRDVFKERVARLTRERRQLGVALDETLASLHERLHDLFGRHDLLGGDHGSC